MDADALSRHGLAGMDHMPQTYYHTRRDTYDNIDEGCIRLSFNISLEAARLYDERATQDENSDIEIISASGE